MLSRSLCIENDGGGNIDVEKSANKELPTKSVGFGFRDLVTGVGAMVTRDEMRALVTILRPIYDRGIKLTIDYSEIAWPNSHESKEP